jgi:hypothetical protein
VSNFGNAHPDTMPPRVEDLKQKCLLDITAKADAREGIRQGLEDVRTGRIRLAEDFFHEFDAKHGLSRQDHASRRARRQFRISDIE